MKFLFWRFLSLHDRHWRHAAIFFFKASDTWKQFKELSFQPSEADFPSFISLFNVCASADDEWTVSSAGLPEAAGLHPAADGLQRGLQAGGVAVLALPPHQQKTHILLNTAAIWLSVCYSIFLTMSIQWGWDAWRKPFPLIVNPFSSCLFIVEGNTDTQHQYESVIHLLTRWTESWFLAQRPPLLNQQCSTKKKIMQPLIQPFNL